LSLIRPFSFSDLDSILEIEAQSFPKSPYAQATFIYLHYLHPKTFLVYVDKTSVRKEGRILGYIVYSSDGHIISIAVHANHRRRGIGTELLKKAMTTPHIKKIWAEVRRGNQGAQAFYLRMGFQISGIVPNYYRNEDAFIIQWTSPSVTDS
jgi:ribosomal-protein-alanine acetyltransferase